MKHYTNSDNQTNGLSNEQFELALQCIQTICRERKQHYTAMKDILTIVENENPINEQSLKLIRLMHNESRDSYLNTVNYIKHFFNQKEN